MQWYFSALSRSWVALWSRSVSISPESVHYTTIVFIVWSPCYAVIFFVFSYFWQKGMCQAFLPKMWNHVMVLPETVQMVHRRHQEVGMPPTLGFSLWLNGDLHSDEFSDRLPWVVQEGEGGENHLFLFCLKQNRNVSFSAVMLEDALTLLERWSLNFFSWKKKTMWKDFITATIDRGA